MIEEIKRVGRGERVSSIDNRIFDKKLYTGISNQYHRLIQVLGKVRTMSASLAATNAAISRIISSMTVDEENIQTITTNTEPIYPYSCGDNQKAEIADEYGIIISKRMNTSMVFIDTLGNILPSIEIMRTTTSGVTDTQIISAITDNALDNILMEDDPYLAKFIGQGLTSANLTVDIYSRNKSININAIRCIPMPAIDAVSMLLAKYDGINPVVVNGSKELTTYLDYTSLRSFPGYIHFEPVETQLIRFMFVSNLYVSSLSAIIIGLSRIIGEYNTYAKKSYIGYKITPPDGATKIKNIAIYTDGFGESVDNVNIKIYDNQIDFDAMSNDYIKLVSQVMDVDMILGAETYYLLEFESVNNTTPTVNRIVTEFE